MKDDITQIKPFMRFLMQTAEKSEDHAELKGAEEAALEIFYIARKRRRSLYTAQESQNG